MEVLKFEENSRNHIVFDFDCTLTNKHWWKGIYLNQFSNDSNLMETLNDDELFIVSNVDKFGPNNPIHKSKQFKNIPNLLKYLWGGNERLKMIKTLITDLHYNNVRIHISTNGCLYEVMALLDMSDIDLNMFMYIHGYNDERNAKIMYDTHYKECLKFATFTKIEFIEYVNENYKPNEYVYIDDDSKEYTNACKICKTINLRYENGGINDNYVTFIKEIFKLI